MVIAFDPTDPRYKCCCGCCRAKSGAVIIAVLDSIFIGSFVIAAIRNFLSAGGEGGLGYFLPLFVILGFALIAVILLFIGIYKESGKLIIPELISLVLRILFCIVLVILLGLVLAGGTGVVEDFLSQIAGTENFDHDWETIARIFLLVVFIILALINTWWALIIVACYRYFSEVQRAKRYYDQVAYSAAPQQIVVHNPNNQYYPVQEPPSQPQNYQPPPPQMPSNRPADIPPPYSQVIPAVDEVSYNDSVYPSLPPKS